MQLEAETHGLNELVYEYTLDITRVTDYGVALGDIVTGAAPIPPEGARFDVWFEGPVRGPRLSGRATGVDYLTIHADGRMDLHIHAEIVTADGERISLFADGICAAKPNDPVAELRENVRLFSSHPQLRWVNALQIWGVGTVDLARQKIHIAGYAA